jgi:hypothetical protein
MGIFRQLTSLVGRWISGGRRFYSDSAVKLLWQGFRHLQHCNPFLIRYDHADDLFVRNCHPCQWPILICELQGDGIRSEKVLKSFIRHCLYQSLYRAVLAGLRSPHNHFNSHPSILVERLRLVPDDECYGDFSPTDQNGLLSPCMEYRGIWVLFCVLWFLMGTIVAAAPIPVARLLGRKGHSSHARLLAAWRIIGVVVAVGALTKLFSVLTSQ